MTSGTDIALRGGPDTAVTENADGLASYAVSFRALGPRAALLADRAGMLAALGAATSGLSVLLAQTAPPHPLVFASAVLIPVACTPLLRWACRLLAGREITVRFETDAIAITRGWRTVRVSRALRHTFALLENDAAPLERERRDYDRQRGRKPVLFMPLYHHHAPHLILEVPGSRIDIATILGRDVADRILRRLTACDDLMDTQDGVGRAPTATPADEQKPRPGALLD